jgi:glycerophosphoryl diester phosphodiesterase
MPYRPLASEAGRIHVCAHRGHSIAAPENTLPALIAAAERGATVCEIDVVLTADDEIVLLHDEILDRTTTGSGLAADLSLSELRTLDAGSWLDRRFAGTRVPTLAEALIVARQHGMGLLVEIKERRRADRLIEHLPAVLANHLDEVLVISFDHPSLLRVQQHLPGASTELITHARHVDIASIARRSAAASVSIEWDMFHPEDAQALHDAGVAVRVTIPRPDKLAWRRAHGLNDLPPIREALAQGLIDVLAGDDTEHVAALVRDSSPYV